MKPSPWLQDLLEAVSSDQDSFAGTKFIAFLIAQIAEAEIFIRNSVGIFLLADAERSATVEIPCSYDAFRCQKQKSAGAIDFMVHIVDAFCKRCSFSNKVADKLSRIGRTVTEFSEILP